MKPGRRPARAALCLGLIGSLCAPLAAVPPAGAPRPAAVGDDPGLSGDIVQGGWARGRVPPGSTLALDGQPVALAPDGAFFIAFDRDAPPAETLNLRLPGGQVRQYALAIARRPWRIERIPIGPKPGTPPDPAFLERRTAELAQIAAARAEDHPADGWRQRFIWPVLGRISGLFGSQRIYNGTPGSYHSGTDIATGTSGTPFVAPADGVVVLAAAAPFTLEGHLLIVDHGMGLNSAFLHCSSLAVKVGDVVRQGQVLGTIGMSGRATGPHLHWSVKWRDARLDPAALAGPMPSR